MIYSSSSVWSLYKFNDAFYYVKHQLIFFVIGIIVIFILRRFDYRFFYKYSNVILGISFLLLALVLIPGIGQVRNGSRSWFGIGSLGIQPSELSKLALIIFTAKYLSNNEKELRSVKNGVFPIILIIFLFFGLIMLEPDFGTGMVIVGTLLCMLFVSNIKISFFVGMGILGLLGIVGLIIIAPYRMQRIVSFLNPWVDPLGSGFQIIQSLYAIGPGGLFGLGFGNSIQKHFYLPEPQTDFIFSIVVEEFGLIGGLLLLVLFAMLFYFGFRYAKNMEDPFDTFLITGLLGVILIQVIINLGVVVALFPVTGITLPFISYGGSSLSVTMFSLGLILSRGRKENEYAHTLRRVR